MFSMFREKLGVSEETRFRHPITSRIFSLILLLRTHTHTYCTTVIVNYSKKKDEAPEVIVRRKERKVQDTKKWNII